MMKKFFVILLVIFIFLSFNIVALADDLKLTDINNHWGKGVIEKLISIGSISGYPDGTFKPNNSMTVGEFTKVLITSLEIDPGNAEGEHWSMNYIREAESKDIIKNAEFSNYNKNITRGEIARMIVRTMTESYPSNMEKYAGQIADYNQISSGMKDYVLKAYVMGIITGYEDGTFRHNGEATRAEASAMVMRMLDESERQIPGLKEEEPQDDKNQDNAIKDMTDFPSKPVIEFATENIPKMFRSDIKVEKAYIASYEDFPIKIGHYELLDLDIIISDIKIEPDTERSNVLFAKLLEGNLSSMDLGFITNNDDFFRQRRSFGFIDEDYNTISEENGYMFYPIANSRDSNFDSNFRNLELSDIDYIYFHAHQETKDILVIPNPF
ncbi:MAG: hypothetical protein APF76_04875 [Desulfitibacter sp. BRH_c19]|nr:MAG: hypothetical protein APF76_04875 [Desulfitibacter sp. BRH_c19]